MLTVSADEFPVLKRFHKPCDEKRKRAARKDKNLSTAENYCSNVAEIHCRCSP